MGVITELATSAPGYNSLRPNTCAPLAQTLTLNGYSTAQFGKCHEVPVWQTSPMGPFDAWPSKGGGFEYFYGFIGGETNQYYPAIYAVSDDYRSESSVFTGTVNWVQIDIDAAAEDLDHLITPEERFRVAMARQ
jgi:arylsulfatase A-like enzyme